MEPLWPAPCSSARPLPFLPTLHKAPSLKFTSTGTPASLGPRTRSHRSQPALVGLPRLLQTPGLRPLSVSSRTIEGPLEGMHWVLCPPAMRYNPWVRRDASAILAHPRGALGAPVPGVAPGLSESWRELVATARPPSLTLFHRERLGTRTMCRSGRSQKHLRPLVRPGHPAVTEARASQG